MLFLHLLARATPAVGVRGLVPAPLSRALLASTTRRTFVSSTRLSVPAITKPAAREPAARKPAARKPAARKATPAEKKPAAKATTKRKPAVKKVVAAKTPVVKKKKKVVPKVPRVTRAMGPPPYATTPFIFFNMEERAKDPSVLPVARSKQSSVKWQQMSESEKEPYMQRAREAREKARIAREKWFNEVDPLLLRRLNAQRRAKKLPRFRNPNKTDRKPLSPYFQFLVEHRATAAPAGTHPREVSKAVGALWRALEPSEKEVYVSKAKEEKEAFQREHHA